MEENFRIVIVGGSVAGLSLALMLEKNGIDFVLLEGYGEIAPQVGASIAMLPNGFRILDQLGCYEEFMEIAEEPARTFSYRDSNGKPLTTLDNLAVTMISRFGYPLVFVDRRMLIQLLYDQIQDKSKILTSKRVATVETTESQATVTTKDGESFTGDIVIGADGIHSTVRQQMWKEGNKIRPGSFDLDEPSKIPCTYSCIFGISQGVPGIEKGSLTSVMNENFSYLLSSGPGDRSYWCLFERLGPKTVYGADIPRFTDEDKEAAVKKHLDDIITPEVRFSDLYKHRISAIYTPLPEYVYDKWHFGRIGTIGDAVHKFEPLSGQGGNTAIETSAALTNAIVAALRNSQKPSLNEITSMFERVQKQRERRAGALIKASHARQRFEALETPFFRFLSKYCLGWVINDRIYDSWYPTFAPAVSLDMFPIPSKPKVVPYEDQRLRKPTSRGKLGVLVYIIFAAMAYTASQLLSGALPVNGTGAFIQEVMRTGLIEENLLRRSYTGIKPIDAILQILVTVFVPAINSDSPEQRLHAIYFLFSLIPVIGIIAIEGYRPRNRLTLLACPTIWAILFQLKGIGLIAPIYMLLATFTSRKAIYFATPTRTLPVPQAQAILPALFIGYVMPTIMLFFPFGSNDTHQIAVAAWQPSPVYVLVLTGIFSRVIPSTKSENKNETLKWYQDLPHLDTIYKATGVVATTVHIAFMIGCLSSDNLSLWDMFIPKDTFSQVSSLADGIFIFFQNDLLLCFAAAFLWCLVNTWDVFRVGISNISVLKGLVYLILGNVLIGPGGTVAAFWYWREHILAQKEFTSV